MKLITPEISWHQKEPIFSAHLLPQTWKLATGGADSTVKIWLIKEKEDGDNSIGIDFIANLDRHAKPVNVVRFSPNGSMLASAGDDGTIILWKLNENEKCSSEMFDDDIVNKENWIVYKMLRGHIEDVYDLAWSPDSTQLLSGSVDNSAIIWDTVKGQNQKVITDHNHYVQGVCWDPRNFYVATHSSDRSCRLYATSNYKCLFNVSKNTMSYEKNGQLVKTKCSRMFMDETMQSFFRRCTFSTDGSYLFLPAGLCDGDGDKPQKTTYVFARGQYKRPICHLPGSKKATVAVKCSPIVYELIEDKENVCSENNEYFKVPYRMVYAVASLDAITIYDTQHNLPIGHCANLHYASLTDITWSSDGKLLVVSSTDGYCSFIKFEEEELGKPIMYDPIEFQITQAKIRKKKKKQETKKKEVKKSVTEKPKDKDTEVVEKIYSPLSTDAQKERLTPIKSVVDSKQPTIEKLFITPIRKRKRTQEIPQNDTIKKSSSPVNKTTTPMSPQPLESATHTNLETKIPPAVSKTSLQKPPKRIQVITLVANNSPTTQQKPVTTNPEKVERNPSLVLPPLTKVPKRASVTTLSSATDKLSKLSPNNIHKHFVATTSNTEKYPPNPLTSPNKTPKRVTVTTLSSSSTEKPPPIQLISPNKIPKRVNVTTLVTFNSSPKTEDGSPVTKSVTPSKATYTAVIPPLSPAVIPPSSPAVIPPASPAVIPPASPAGIKQPKRITVQTLSTFTDVRKSVELEEEESPLTNIPVQVDPPQLDDIISNNSFDASLIETVLNNSNSEKVNVSVNIDNPPDLDVFSLNTSSSGASKVEAILID